MVIFSEIPGDFDRAIKLIHCHVINGRLRNGKKVGVEGKVGNELC